jgi:hypothetical protein
MAQQFGDHLDRDVLTKHPGGIGVPEPVRFKPDARLPPEPQHEIMDGGICHCLPVGQPPQVDEDVVGIQATVFDVEVVGIQPDQFGGDGNRARMGRFSARTIGVGAPADRDFPFGDGDVLMPEPQRFTDPGPST